KARLLFQLSHEAVNGRSVTVDDITDICEDHIAKQTAAQIAVSISAGRDSRLVEVMARASREAAAREELERVIRAKARRTPTDRHEERMKALYVDIKEDGSGWSRPCDYSREDARGKLTD